MMMNINSFSHLDCRESHWKQSVVGGPGDVPWYFKLQANDPGIGRPHRPSYLGCFQTKQTILRSFKGAKERKFKLDSRIAPVISS